MNPAISTKVPGPASATEFLNIAVYKFVSLDDLEALRDELKHACVDLGLRGTILLSREGINMFLAGVPERVESFLGQLAVRPEFQELDVKKSYSSKVPFRRMLVRLKKEIIPCGLAEIQPGEKTSPKLPAEQLKRWLDEGKQLRLLDVRNNYEIELGTFRGAEHLSLGHFRDFQEAIDQFPEAAKSEPIVMFCTGGIRCEKAGPVMEKAGFREVYQLDGGILKYFEECGDAHYDGACFVFDGRVALDPQLKPTGNLLCFSCQAVLTSEDVSSGKFLFGEYCPQCYVDPDQRRAEAFLNRQAAVRAVAETQPGSQPYDNLREIHVPGRFAGWKLIDFLDAWQPAIGREQWLGWLAQGHITNHVTCQPEQLVREGECFRQHMPDTVEPEINPDIALIHEDDSLVVVNKPAPLPTHPSGRFHRNTLSYILGQVYSKEKLRVTHRLDANTTGVVLLCRRYQPARFVQPQFTERQVGKVYFARVHGVPDWREMICREPISDRPAGKVGGRRISPTGLAAETQFRVIEKFADGTTLVEAIPLTGRTHQIRLHLAHLGHSVLGDPLYLENSEMGQSQTLPRGAAPMCLHAHSLRLIHPDSRKEVSYQAPLPEWARS